MAGAFVGEVVCPALAECLYVVGFEAHGVRPFECVVDGLSADVAVGAGGCDACPVLLALTLVTLCHV